MKLQSQVFKRVIYLKWEQWHRVVVGGGFPCKSGAKSFTPCHQAWHPFSYTLPCSDSTLLLATSQPRRSEINPLPFPMSRAPSHSLYHLRVSRCFPPAQTQTGWEPSFRNSGPWVPCMLGIPLHLWQTHEGLRVCWKNNWMDPVHSATSWQS